MRGTTQDIDSGTRSRRGPIRPHMTGSRIGSAQPTTYAGLFRPYVYRAPRSSRVRLVGPGSYGPA